MLRTVTSVARGRAASIAAGTLVSCRLITYRCAARTGPMSSPRNPLTASCSALCSPRRAVTTAAQENASDTAAPTDEQIIAAADWKSAQLEERLGFRHGDVITEARLKRHYYVLAKHFHPDTATSGAGAEDGGGATASADAFHKVKEAYDEINASLKGVSGWSGFGGGGGSSGYGGGGFAGGYTYSDEARRRSQMRLLGDTVMLFLAMTLLFIFVVGRHNKNRMQSRHLWHLVFIFFMIQLFPRLLAAAILFAAHSTFLLENATLKEQAAVSLVVERREEGCTVKLEGIRPDAVKNVVVQVTTTMTPALAAETQKGTVADGVAEVSSTLTFDKGVTEFQLPVPVSQQQSTYTIKAVDEARKLVLVERTISAAAAA